MQEYTVTIELNGEQVTVGKLSGNSADDTAFCYADPYLEESFARPISISLPLQKESFSPEQTSTFFEGLLPEGFTRRSVAQWMQVDESDYVSILHGLGRECIGALRVLADDEDDTEAYEEIGIERVKELAAEGASKAAEIVINTHLSLAGASGKVGLYYDEKNGEWFLPRGLAPSTHIVKQSHVRLDGIVTNEQLSMLTAAGCGIITSESFIINTGEGSDKDILFATKRYDRKIGASSKMISSFKRPLRLHQEDFAQAMGIPASKKYEPEGCHYAKEMFEYVRKYSADPLADQMQLLDRIIFSYIIGNNDGHIKNYSFLYDEGLKTVRLAPAYDIICTAIYSGSTRRMSFNIGGDLVIDEIGRDSFTRMASETGLGGKMVLGRLDTLLDRFEASLEESERVLLDLGFANAGAIAERILQSRKGILG